MDAELLYSKFYQALKEQRYLDAKNIVYQAHREGMPAGHILVKLVNRALDQLQKSMLAEITNVVNLNLLSESKKYFEYLITGNRNEARKLIDELIENKIVASDIMLRVITPAMDDIGNLQARQEISLSQIFIAAKITEQALELLIPLMPPRTMKLGKIILGNAFGDHHGLGRKIIAVFMRFYGFEVIDLGLSVPNEKFVEQAARENADLIFVSAFLLHTARQISGLRQMLNERNLSQIKIVAGGAPFNFDRQLYKDLGSDACAPDGLAAVQVAKNLLGVA